MIRILKIFFLLILGLVAISILGIAGFFAYEWYEKEQELSMWTGREWSWHQRSEGVQISKGNGQPTLRKVYRAEKYSLYFDLSDNETHPFSVRVYWRQKCEPGTVIPTSKKYSNGKTINLLCASHGQSVFYSASHRIFEGTFKRSFDGFEFSEYVGRWDLTPLHRWKLLSGAKEKQIGPSTPVSSSKFGPSTPVSSSKFGPSTLVEDLDAPSDTSEEANWWEEDDLADSSEPPKREKERRPQ